MRRLVYVVGLPGAGKTTLVDHAIEPWQRVPQPKPFAHDLLVDRVTGELQGAWLGAARGPFSGTDALSMSVSPVAVRWLSETVAPAVIGEGDRLAHRKFLDGATAAGWTVCLVWLDVPVEVALARRTARAASTPAATWVAGRVTKVERLVGGWNGVVMRLDGRRPVDELAPAVTALLA